MDRIARIPGVGPSGTARRFRLLGLLLAGGLLPAAFAAAAGAAAPRAEDGKAEAPVDLRRLQFEYRCFFDTKGWEGKGEVEFLRRLRAQRAAYAASAKEKLPAFEDLMAEALWKRAEFHRAAKDLKSASELADEILALESGSGRVAELRPRADDLVIEWSLSEAKRYENVEKNDAMALEAYRNCLRTGNAEALKEAMAGVVRILLRLHDYEGVRAINDLAAEGAAVQRILADLAAKVPPGVLSRGWPDVQRLRDRQTQIEESAGYVDVTFLPVAGDLQKYKGPAAPLDAATARLRFVPVSEGQPWPSGNAPAVATSPALLLIRGTYDVHVFAPGVAEPSCIWLRVPVGKARYALEIPGRAPEGMVYVGPWQGGGGFFIDRTEVTVGQVLAAAAKDPGLEPLAKNQEKTDANLPAWFLDDKKAGAEAAGMTEKFAASVGKRIPSLKQWKDAAYGPAPAAYPWGNEAPDPAKHFVLGGDEPQPVGSRPAGASPYGCLDMAGNVNEWTEGPGGLWSIGGDKGAALDADGIQRLKDAIPGSVAYAKLGDAEKNRFTKVKEYWDEYWTTGLRLVIPVK